MCVICDVTSEKFSIVYHEIGKGNYLSLSLSIYIYICLFYIIFGTFPVLCIYFVDILHRNKVMRSVRCSLYLK